MTNTPDGFPSAYPPGPDTWWTGLAWQWQSKLPTAVTRATAIIVNPLCRMPWQIRRPDATIVGPDADGYPAWLVDPALNGGSSGGPNPGVFDQLDRPTRFDLFSRWVRDALWVGLGLLAFEPGADGPRAGTVQLINPTHLYRGEGGWLLEYDGVLYEVDRQSGTVPVWSEQAGRVMRLRLVPLRHSLPGGVLGWHRAQVALADRMTSYATETFDSGVPSGILSADLPLTQDQADRAREEWRNKQHTRQIAVLGNGTKYQPVAISPVDSELVAMGRLSNESLAHAFELPAWYLDAAMNTMTYSNAQWYRQDLVDGVLSSWSARIEETISGLLPWGTRMVIDFDQFTRPIGIEEGADSGAAATA
jgi:hypothetical protein